MTTSPATSEEGAAPQPSPDHGPPSRTSARDWDWGFLGFALAVLTLLVAILGLGVMGFFHLDNRIDHLDNKIDARFDRLDAKIDARFNRLDEKIDTRFGQLQDLILSLNQPRQAPVVQ